jgi:hypothetical protein
MHFPPLTLPLQKVRKFYLIIKLVQPCSLYLKSSNPIRLLRQNDFRTFCRSEETEKVYQKLEEIINIG